jgi:hypothetical protein
LLRRHKKLELNKPFKFGVGLLALVPTLNLRGFMLEANSENYISNQEEFESEQNLLGLFSILLRVDKRVNPQNYEYKKKEND